MIRGRGNRSVNNVPTMQTEGLGFHPQHLVEKLHIAATPASLALLEEGRRLEAERQILEDYWSASLSQQMSLRFSYSKNKEQ